MQNVICHLIATNFYGGPEKQIVEHLQQLTPKFFKGVVVSFLEGEKNEIIDKAATVGLENHTILMSGPLDVRALLKLNRFIKAHKISLLCVHGYKATVMGSFCGKLNNIPVLAFSRGYTAENKKIAFYEWLDRLFLKKLNGIVSVSEGQRKKLASLGVYGKKSWVVHNAVGVPEYSVSDIRTSKKKIFEKFNIPEDHKIVVSAGRLSPEKGHIDFVEAIKLLPKSFDDVTFIFCGEGVCKEALKRKAHEYGIDQKCRFPGFQENMQEFYLAMDFMVLPSLTEGLPNVILEAFSYAKTVVSTSVGGVPELVEHEVNGMLVPSERPDLLSASIVGCLSNPQKVREMGEAGKRLVRSEFSFAGQTEKLENIYNNIINTV